MTTVPGPDLPPELIIELASASVDDALSPGEAAQTETSPQVKALAAEFAKLRGHLGAPAEIPPALRDAHLAAAMEAFDLEAPTVRSLDAARARRARRLAPVLAAAAAIAVIGVVAGALAGRGSDGPSVSADGSAAETAAADPGVLARAATDPDDADALLPEVDTGTDTPMSAESTKQQGDEPSNSEIAEPAPLVGDTPSDIPALVASALEARAAAVVAPPDTTCADLQGEPIASITWKATAALLLVAPSTTAPTDAFVIDATTCEVIASATLGS